MTSRLLKKSARGRKVVSSGVPHPLPTHEKSLVGRSGRSGFGNVSLLGIFNGLLDVFFPPSHIADVADSRSIFRAEEV